MQAKLLREVETEVLSSYETRLLQKEHSGCAALLRDDKVGVCVWGGGRTGPRLRRGDKVGAGGYEEGGRVSPRAVASGAMG